ncbi:MAG: DUF4190 domain-containing protein [Verrucomicrobiales bacterium]
MDADPPPQSPAAPPLDPTDRRLAPSAVWSLVLGVLSMGCLWLLGSIPAIILGIVALRRIEDPVAGLRGRGLAIGGIVTGGLGVFTGLFAAAGILAGLLFPAVNGTLRKAELVHAENTAYNLKTAISAYQTEYSKIPAGAASGAPVDLQTDHELMDILFGADNQSGEGGLNPRGIAFYTGKQAKPMGNGRYRKGIMLQADGTGELWDPWGNHYRVRLGDPASGRTENPEIPGSMVPESILVWSAGHDGDFDTWEDNVRTW